MTVQAPGVPDDAVEDGATDRGFDAENEGSVWERHRSPWPRVGDLVLRKHYL